MKKQSIGEIAFLGGVALAVLISFLPSGDLSTPNILLTILGVLIGILNITKKETTTFLLASIALLLAGSAGLGTFPGVGIFFDNLAFNLGQVVAPATMIVALKTIVNLASRT